MSRQVEIRLPESNIEENSAFTATVVSKTRATQAAEIPTTIDYRVFNRSTGEIIRDWTSVTPAASVEISVNAQDNVVKQRHRRTETMELVVSTDKGLSTEVSQQARYRINRIRGRN